MKISELVEKSHANAKSKGFYDDGAGQNIPERLMLIVSEVAEALEDYRDGSMEARTLITGKPVGFPTELADVVIRIADMCGHMGIDLEKVIAEKMEFNAGRPRKHGKVC